MYDKQSFLEHHWDDTVGKWLGGMVSVLSRTIHEAIDIYLALYPSLSIYKYMYVCMNTSQLFFFVFVYTQICGFIGSLLSFICKHVVTYARG